MNLIALPALFPIGILSMIKKIQVLAFLAKG
jgi:hypothetical protein